MLSYYWLNIMKEKELSVFMACTRMTCILRRFRVFTEKVASTMLLLKRVLSIVNLHLISSPWKCDSQALVELVYLIFAIPGKNFGDDSSTHNVVSLLNWNKVSYQQIQNQRTISMLTLTSIALPLVKEYYSDPPDVH